MSVKLNPNNIAYGLTDALLKTPFFPIVTTRNPGTTDYAPLGTWWVNKTNNNTWILTSIVAGVATWTGGTGGAGAFATVTAVTTIAAGTTITAGGNITSTGGNVAATAGNVTAGGSMTAGAAITSTAGNITATAGSVNAGTSLNATTTLAVGTNATITGTLAAGATTITGATGITGALTQNGGATNIGTDANANAINIGIGGGAKVVTIGSTTGAAHTLIQGGTLGVSFNTTGLVFVSALDDTQASPSAVSVLDATVGVAEFTGFTTASAASQVFTITNAIVIATSGILVSVSNGGANDAQMHVTRVKAGAGTFDVTVKNDGAQALNGNVYIAFWVLV